uniref:Tripartite motif-containing protein 16-like n=1 Tax=Sinocyclocheilus rhinocerous TaxID=307959 RepID=A0A673MVJ8_9TELE
MAEASISWAEDQFSCPVCLGLLKEPVTIPCGHSYCKRCILGSWAEEDWKGIYRCPQCRQTFTPRPVLGKNVVFAEMVEKLKKTRLQAAPSPVPTLHHHTGSVDVKCDSCTLIKRKAVKSCLECRSSYCQNHLKQHENLFRGKAHNLMDATGRLQEMMCPQHDKMLEVYCRTDHRCICMLCLVDEHKNHDTVSTVAARTEKQRHLEGKQRKFQKIIQQREKDLQELREAVASHKRFAQTAVEDSERIFTEIIRSIEKRRSEVKQLIRDQERAAVSRAEARGEELEQEINDLKRRDTELKQFSEAQDHVHFLQSWPPVSFSESTDGFTVSSHLSFDNVVESVSRLRDKLLQFCTETIENLSGTVKTVQVIGAPEYQTREGFTLNLHSVTYKSIKRKGGGSECAAGRNDKSWNLYCTPTFCSFWHNNIETVLPVTHVSSRIGVFVDHSAGTLSFYSVSDTMSLIHRAQTTFTQPLYAVFGFDRQAVVKLCRLTN